MYTQPSTGTTYTPALVVRHGRSAELVKFLIAQLAANRLVTLSDQSRYSLIKTPHRWTIHLFSSQPTRNWNTDGNPGSPYGAVGSF